MKVGTGDILKSFGVQAGQGSGRDRMSDQEQKLLADYEKPPDQIWTIPNDEEKGVYRFILAASPPAHGSCRPARGLRSRRPRASRPRSRWKKSARAQSRCRSSPRAEPWPVPELGAEETLPPARRPSRCRHLRGPACSRQKPRAPRAGERPRVRNRRRRVKLLAALAPLLAVCVDAQQLTVEDWEPRSTLVVGRASRPAGEIPRSWDVHSHHRSGTSAARLLDQIVGEMDDLNLAVLVNLSGGSGARLRETVENFRARHPSRFAVFANPDFDGIGEPGWPETCRPPTRGRT